MGTELLSEMTRVLEMDIPRWWHNNVKGQERPEDSQDPRTATSASP